MYQDQFLGNSSHSMHEMQPLFDNFLYNYDLTTSANHHNNYNNSSSSIVINDDATLETLQRLRQNLQATRFVIQKILTPLLVLFGVTGNLINIVVLTRRWMKSSTNCYLCALAVFDSLYVLLAFSLSLHHYEYFKTSASYTHYRMPYGRPLTDVCSNTGVWLTVTFTFERYIGVQYPIKGRIWCTCERARKLVGVVFTVALLLTLPEFFEKKASYYSYYSSRLEQNVTRCNVTDREVVANLLKSLGYYKMNQILFTFLPLLLLIIFNGLLVRTVLQATKLRHLLTNVNTTSLNKTNINASNSRTTDAGTSLFGRKTSTGCKNKNVKFSDSTNDSNTHKEVHDGDIYEDKPCGDAVERDDEGTNDDTRGSTNNNKNNTSIFLHPKKRKIIFRMKRNASSTIADNNDGDRCTSQSMPMITITSHSPNSTDNKFVQPNQPPQLSSKQQPQQHSPNQQQQQQQHATRDQQKITIMLIIVVVVFLVCQLPQAVQKLVEVYLEPKHDGVTRIMLMITANYFNLLVMLNASCNFILYSSLSVKFRRTFLHLYCRRFDSNGSHRPGHNNGFKMINRRNKPTASSNQASTSKNKTNDDFVRGPSDAANVRNNSRKTNTSCLSKLHLKPQGELCMQRIPDESVVTTYLNELDPDKSYN